MPSPTLSSYSSLRPLLFLVFSNSSSSLPCFTLPSLLFFYLLFFPLHSSVFSLTILPFFIPSFLLVLFSSFSRIIFLTKPLLPPFPNLFYCPPLILLSPFCLLFVPLSLLLILSLLFSIFFVSHFSFNRSLSLFQCLSFPYPIILFLPHSFFPCHVSLPFQIQFPLFLFSYSWFISPFPLSPLPLPTLPNLYHSPVMSPKRM